MRFDFCLSQFSGEVWSSLSEEGASEILGSTPIVERLHGVLAQGDSIFASLAVSS